VDEYGSELKGSVYDGIKIKDVLQMASGVKFDKTYSDPKTDINRYWEGFVFGKSQDRCNATLINQLPARKNLQYVSIIDLF
jgi:hypothetical protein